MSAVSVDILGLKEIVRYFETFPDVSKRAMSLSLNRAIGRDGMKMARQEILSQVAFPKDYLKGDRLYVSRFAKPTDLEASITGRKRATSLARFAQGAHLGGRSGVRVSVKPGSARALRKAWLVRLRRGASLTEDNYNIGLALRVSPGANGRVLGKKSPHTSWLVPGKVALLYGPSVNQVFEQVAGDISGPVADAAVAEFFRQFQRLAG